MPTHIRSHPRPQLAASGAVSQPQGAITTADTRLQLANRLQSSLDVLEVLTQFFAITQNHVASAGMVYENIKKHIKFSFGKPQTHSARYNLQIGRSQLGELGLWRTQPFTAAELSDIEMLLSLLMLPLRNALLYRDALEHSLRDPLTGIGNRSALDAALKREYKLARRSHSPLSVVVADIDFFKQVNDRAGHAAGDSLIKQTAQTIAASIRQTDQVFRFGGEEYVIVLGATEHPEALCVAERIRKAVAKMELTTKAGTLSLTMSLGVSTLRQNDSKESFFERADDALYEAKALGRDRVVSAEVAATEPNKKHSN